MTRDETRAALTAIDNEAKALVWLFVGAATAAPYCSCQPADPGKCPRCIARDLARRYDVAMRAHRQTGDPA